MASMEQEPDQDSIGLDLEPEPEVEAEDHISAEERFVMRAEALRLQQEWAHDLDMRRFVSEPCKRRHYNSRFFWLDEASLTLFREGLKRNGGIFTIASYEEILADARLRGNRTGRSAPATIATAPARPAAMLTTGDTAERQMHEVLKFGYFENRRTDRIKYVTRVLLISDGPIIPGRTRNISESGTQIQTAFVGDYQVGDVVRIKFPNLPEIKDIQVRYRVVRMVRKLNVYSVSLRCEETKSHPITAFVRNLIAGQTGDGEGQLHLDAEDASLTAESLLAERYYMHSTGSIPFFLSSRRSREFEMTAVCYNEANEDSLVAFATAQGGNELAALMNRRYRRLFMRLAQIGGMRRATLAVWRTPDGDGIETLMDLECRRPTDWYARLAKHRQADDFRVFRVVLHRAYRPNDHRIARDLEPLAAKSPDDAERLLRDSGRLIAVGALIDCTAEIRTWNLAPYESVGPGEIRPDSRQHEERETGQPALLPIDYVERSRSHDRFLLRLPVRLEIQDRTLETLTRDISLTGISVLLPEGAPPITPGQSVQITLSNLAQQANLSAPLRRSLKGVAYEVVGTAFGEEILLRMLLQEPERQEQFTRALLVFLQQKQSTLRLERTHSVQAAATRVHSSFFIAAAPTLPILYFRSSTDDSTPVARACMTQKPNRLVAFFETSNESHDFAALTTPALTSHLWNEMEGRKRGETNLYLIKERVPNKPWYRISAVADFNFADRAERDAFLDRSAGQDLRIFKITMLPPRQLAAPELVFTFGQLERYSARRAAKLREDFEGLVAIGDVVDITGAFYELRHLAPSEIGETSS